ncbi:hypothetical protein GCK32_012656, partial [Trichostrongylus colubriformis]
MLIQITEKEDERDGMSGLEPGESALYLNGLNLDMDSLDIFQLFNIIRQEELVSTGFFNLGFRRDYLPILTNIDLSEDKNKYAVDYRSAYPMFLNNLDTDVRYKHWRNSVKLLLEPYYPGMIRPIARNLFTLIFVLDPAHEDSRKLLKMAHTLYEHEVPLRIGLLFAVESNEAVNGTNDVGVAILNLLNFLAVDNAYHDALRIVVEPLTLWVVADLDSEHGRQIVYSAIKSLKRSSMTRLGIIMNPSNPTTLCEENSIPSLVNAAMRLLPHTQAKQFITKLVKEQFAKDLHSGAMKWEELAVGGMDVNKFENEKRLLNCEPLKFDGIFVRDVLKLSPGERAFIANGIIVGPFDEQETIIESDVELIARIVDSRGSSIIASQIDKWSADSGSDSPSDLVMQSFALVLKHGVNRKRTFVTLGKYKN